MKNTNLKTFFSFLGFDSISPTFIALFTLVLFQQIIVASSSYWLAEFSRGLQRNTFSAGLFITFIASLILPYVPAAFSLMFLKIWDYESVSTFWCYSIAKFQNTPSLWSAKELKGIQNTILSKDGPQLISETTRHIYDLISSSLNVLLSLSMLSLLLNFKIFVCFLIGAVLLYYGTYLTKGFNKQAGQTFEHEKLALTGLLNTVWDNIVLGNSYNSSQWKKHYNIRNQNYFQAQKTFVKSQEVASTFISLFGFIPTLLLLAYYGFQNSEKPQQLIPLIALFPRIFILLNTTASLVFLIRNSYAFVGRWNHLLLRMELKKEPDLIDRVSFDRIQVNKMVGEFQNIESLIMATHRIGNRVTIRGVNGAGKSSLLLALKEKFGSKSFYLPHENELVFASPIERCSTGQKLKQQLSELMANSKDEIILLDEWDANLDSENMAALTMQIDQLARSRTVYEVRHRS